MELGRHYTSQRLRARALSIVVFSMFAGASYASADNAGGVSKETDEKKSVVRLVATKFIEAPGELSEFEKKHKDQFWSDDTAGNYSGLYTRFVLEETKESSEDRIKKFDDLQTLPPYQNERCSWLEQFFAGRQRTFSSQVVLKMSDPAEIEVTSPLYSRTHACNTEVGNSFETNFSVRLVQGPMFRLSPGSALTVTFKSEISLKPEAAAVARAYGIVRQGIEALDKGSHFYSEFSKPGIQKAAQATDNALKGLFASSTVEQVVTSRFIDSWKRDRGLFVTSRFNIDAYDPADPGVVGKWKIYLSCPRPSLFSDLTICNGSNGTSTDPETLQTNLDQLRERVAEQVTPGTVLSWSFTDKQTAASVTVADVIASNPAFIEYVKAPANSAAHGKFCASLMNDFYLKGMNEFDAALVLRAAHDGLAALVQYRDQLKKSDRCNESLREAGVER